MVLFMLYPVASSGTTMHDVTASEHMANYSLLADLHACLHAHMLYSWCCSCCTQWPAPAPQCMMSQPQNTWQTTVCLQTCMLACVHTCCTHGAVHAVPSGQPRHHNA